MLGAGGDAQSASVASLRANRERLPIPMKRRLHPRGERQRAFELSGQLANLEDVIGANADAIFLGLASAAIDHRREDSRFVFAVGSR